MKATIQSTDRIVTLTHRDHLKTRVWEGRTENGVAFVAYIAMCQVSAEPYAKQFNDELEQHKRPEDWVKKAIDARLIV